MINIKNKTLFIIVSTLLTCLLLSVIEYGLQLDYIIKTLTKISLFFINIFLYIFLFKDFKFKDMLKISKLNKKEWYRLIILGISSASIVGLAYLFLYPFFDINDIKGDLINRLGITATGFIFVGLYISFFNSFLEEYYFRGFIYFNLPKKLGYIYSPILFASYHIPMIMLWFSPFLIFLCFIGLLLIGIVFHKVNERTRTIWSSWIIHIFADIMIIIIGFTLFY